MENPNQKKMLVIIDNVLYDLANGILHNPFELEEHFKHISLTLVNKEAISDDLLAKIKA